MVKVDLITGFLGAGKTTFIQKYVRYLKNKGESIHIIENEFAEKGVDSAFLQEEEDDCCKISDLSGMCMCCIGKKEFIHLLIESSKTGCSRIIVEPSGIYDVDEFFDVLSDAKVREVCEIGCIITIVDPMMQEQLSEEAKYLMFAQLLASGTIVYSKTQMLDKDSLLKAMDWVNQLVVDKGCENGLMGEVCTKAWEELKDSDFEDMEDSAYYRMVHDRELFEHSSIFQSETFTLRGCHSKQEIQQQVRAFFEDDSYGNIYRIKGYVKTDNGELFGVNCTGQLLAIEEVNNGAEGLVVIGQKLKRKCFL